ncbi:MAG: hypothetical protein Pars2KO_23740 [Parasphingorhabdus sp.]
MKEPLGWIVNCNLEEFDWLQLGRAGTAMLWPNTQYQLLSSLDLCNVLIQ